MKSKSPDKHYKEKILNILLHFLKDNDEKNKIP